MWLEIDLGWENNRAVWQAAHGSGLPALGITKFGFNLPEQSCLGGTHGKNLVDGFSSSFHLGVEQTLLSFWTALCRPFSFCLNPSDLTRPTLCSLPQSLFSEMPPSLQAFPGHVP